MVTVREERINLVDRLEVREVKHWVVVCPICGYENDYERNPMGRGVTHIDCEHCKTTSALRN